MVLTGVFIIVAVFTHVISLEDEKTIFSYDKDRSSGSPNIDDSTSNIAAVIFPSAKMYKRKTSEDPEIINPSGFVMKQSQNIAERNQDKEFSKTNSESYDVMDFQEKQRLSVLKGLDSIGYEKRPLDSPPGSHGLSVFDKRPFDSAAESHALSGLTKRPVDSTSVVADQTVSEKRPFDSISGSHGLSGFAKRPINSEERDSDLEVFDKRPFDSISGSHGLSGFAKRPFDSISGSHGLSGYAKRHFDSISGSHGLSGFAKRPFDSLTQKIFQLKLRRSQPFSDYEAQYEIKHPAVPETDLNKASLIHLLKTRMCY